MRILATGLLTLSTLFPSCNNTTATTATAVTPTDTTRVESSECMRKIKDEVWHTERRNEASASIACSDLHVWCKDVRQLGEAFCGEMASKCSQFTTARIRGINPKL